MAAPAFKMRAWRANFRRRNRSCRMEGMRTLLFLLLAASAYGQPRPFFPPDIVPPETLARRDPLKIDPQHYRLDLENEHVRVIRLTLKADESVPMHDDVDAVAVCVQEC